jgi:hypothetical protein
VSINEARQDDGLAETLELRLWKPFDDLSPSTDCGDPFSFHHDSTVFDWWV